MPLRTPTPRPPGHKPVQRLASIRNPTPGRRTQSKPSAAASSRDATCPNPTCPNPRIVDDEDKKVCAGCGTVIDDAHIVNEITFGETSAGAAVVQGTFVGADQSHGRNFGPGFQRSGMESREVTEQNGKRYINQLSTPLHLPQTTSDAAFQIFKLAVVNNFIQGRRTSSVAAVCLYVACRRQDANQTLLIDFSDLLKVNVFKIGSIYKALLKTLSIAGADFRLSAINLEDLVYRFAKKLEFANSRLKVAEDAIRLVKRMNRDWMVTGRRPNGLCGAALVLAARMNNFRRTIREVAYAVSVTEITIQQRLEEFARTESSALTVDEFRNTQLETAHDPPAFYKAREEKTKKRSRKRKAPENAEEEMEEEGMSPPPAQRRRVDADGFAIPDLPVDPALTAAGNNDTENQNIDPSLTLTVNSVSLESESGELTTNATTLSRTNSQTSPIPNTQVATNSARAGEGASKSSNTPTSAINPSKSTAPEVPPPKRRGRPPKTAKATQKSRKTQATRPTPSELMRMVVESGTVPDEPSSSTDDLANPTSTTDTTEIANTDPQISMPGSNAPQQRHRSVPDGEIIQDNEFDSDPEIQDCLLTDAERAVKERIWLHENHEYLRSQETKRLKRQLEEESGTGRVIKRRKRHRGRIGDVSYIHGEGGASGEGSRASTPAEATRMMLEKRGFSRRINYALLERLYQKSDDEGDGEGDQNGTGSPRSSQGSKPRQRESFILTSKGRKDKAPAKPKSPAPRKGAKAKTASNTKERATTNTAAASVPLPPPSQAMQKPPAASASSSRTDAPVPIPIPGSTQRTPPTTAPRALPDEEIEEIIEDEEGSRPNSSSRSSARDEEMIERAFAGHLPPLPPQMSLNMDDDDYMDDMDEDDEEDGGFVSEMRRNRELEEEEGYGYDPYGDEY